MHDNICAHCLALKHSRKSNESRGETSLPAICKCGRWKSVFISKDVVNFSILWGTYCIYEVV